MKKGFRGRSKGPYRVETLNVSSFRCRSQTIFPKSKGHRSDLNSWDFFFIYLKDVTMWAVDIRRVKQSNLLTWLRINVTYVNRSYVDPFACADMPTSSPHHSTNNAPHKFLREELEASSTLGFTSIPPQISGTLESIYTDNFLSLQHHTFQANRYD